MSFFKASTDKKSLEQSSGGKYINKSGVYPVNIIAPFISVSRNGSVAVDLFVDHKDQKQTIYGSMTITNNNGDANVIGSKIFNQLLIISDVEEVSDGIDAELPIGKKGAGKDVAVLEDLADIDILVHVQQEYSVWNNNIMEKQIIRGFYRAEDNASAEEIVNDSEKGVQYGKDTAYFDKTVYKDGLDEEAVQAWVSANRPKGSASGASAGSSTGAVKRPSFGKRKSFGNND